MIDVKRARDETPGVQHRLHFNNAGAALMPVCVLRTMQQHLELEANIGGYEAKDLVNDRLEGAYRSLSRLLNCEPDEIAVVENATRAWDMAFYGFDFRPGDRILTAVAEYASNYIAFLQMAQKTGVKVEAVPDDAYGQLDMAALKRMIDPSVRLIAITHVPTNGGLVNPAAEIGAIARAHGIPFLLDACQSAGQMPLDVKELQVDMLSATGRKFLRGPRGVGFLYVRREWITRLNPPLLDLHAATWTAADQFAIRDDARRFENWEGNIAAKLGLGAAVDYALGWGLESIRIAVNSLAGELRVRLAAIPGVSVCDLGRDKCGIVSFTVAGIPATKVRDILREQAINVSASPAAYTRLDMDRRGLAEVIRASVHYYNTFDEVDRFTMAVGAIAKG